MTPPFEYRPLDLATEGAEFDRIHSQCFSSPLDVEQAYLRCIGVEHGRVICQDGTLLGGLVLMPMGQWWGGRRVEMTGIASVAIAPQHRGAGAAIALMRAALRELHSQGVPLSMLYAATQRLYRKAGYEQAGFNVGWEASTNVLAMRERSLPIYPLPQTSESLRAIYQQHAPHNNGHLDRHSALWTWLLKADTDEILSVYGLGSPAQPEGYIVIAQRTGQHNSRLRVNDWVALTPAALHTCWTFLADHRSQIKTIQWKSSAVDPLTLVLPEEVAKPLFVERWMLRIVDVKAALEQRGYPAQLQMELHLELSDDVISENTGRFVLTVADGRGAVSSGGSGELKLDIGGLAPLYTGLFNAHQLQIMGLLSGSAAGRAIATQMFAGIPPWTSDFF